MDPDAKWNVSVLFAPGTTYQKEWLRLQDDVCATNADKVFVVNGRVPTLFHWQKLHFLQSWHTHCESAIPWMTDLSGKRIAIVDDCIRTGVTLNNMIDRLIASGASAKNISAHCMFSTQSPKDIVLHGGIKPTFVLDRAIPPDEYEKRIQDLLTYLAMYPFVYQFEYPQFMLRLNDSLKDHDDAIKYLFEMFDRNSVFKPDLPTRQHYFMHRITVNISPVNALWRFRLHLFEEERVGFVIPITPSHKVDTSISHFTEIRKHVDEILKNIDPKREVFPGEARCRFEQFINSIECFFSMHYKFAPIFALEDGIDYRNMLISAISNFGGDIARDILTPLEFVNPKSVRWADITPKDPELPSLFCTLFMQKENGKEFMDALRERIVKRRKEGFTNIVTIVHAFYDAVHELVSDNEKLSKLVDAEGFHPNGKEILENPYLRNVIGPTFADIVWVAKKFYKEFYRKYPEDIVVFNKIAEQMDIDIDNASVIPTYNMQHEQIYRRGEGYLQDKSAMNMMRILSESKRLVNGMPVSLDGLSAEKRQHFSHSLEFMDKVPYWMGM
jgi:hypothetical protein